RCRKKPLLNAPLKNPDPAEVEVTDPTHPLFGRRFVVHSLSQSLGRAGFVYVVYQETMMLRLPVEVTNRHRCPQLRARAKWTAEATEGFLTLFKEVQPACPPAPSGEGSLPNCKRPASRKSRSS